MLPYILAVVGGYLIGDSLKAEQSKYAKGGGVESYPELIKIAKEIADETVEEINEEVQDVKSKMPYKAQFVLEEVVRDLESRI